ncbi:hypothetical protein [Pseudoxanthomonas sp.]|uniref:hypothetical protein n=1 Tax=Pseudoxanthomonas sp. TaxID=1871049 RepID=UPI002616A744|nr:hypothetical protein [Pseudoxanthomonas sp.]WDS35886.1 MAG: hypothetical protein O8I58_16455 [Pseudoxanthomonas sp.]
MAADARRIAIPAANEHLNVCVSKMTMRGESNTVHTRVYQEDGFIFPIWDCLGNRDATTVPAIAAQRARMGSFCQEVPAKIARSHTSMARIVRCVPTIIATVVLHTGRARNHAQHDGSHASFRGGLQEISGTDAARGKARAM